jgi:hypothetical protein
MCHATIIAKRPSPCAWSPSNLPFHFENHIIFVRSEVFTAVTMKNTVFRDTTGVALMIADVSVESIFSIIRALQLVVNANVVPS